MTHEDKKIPEDTEHRKELLRPAFLALLATQFFTAFNDNLFRWLVVPIGQETMGDTQALVCGAVLFTLPYLIFAPVAGFLADRFRKRNVIISCKFAEIVVMLLGVVAIWYGNIYLLMFLVFCMGTQSALFSPSKIGAIPELLTVNALSLGNGLMAMVTIVGIALGQVAGYKVYQSTFGVDHVLDKIWPIAVGLLGIAILGWLVSLLVHTKPAADKNRRWSFNPITELKPSMVRLFQDPPLARAAVGIAFFYFLAILYQVNIDAFGEHTLGLDKSEIGNLMPMLVIGIGVGSVLAGWLSGGTILMGMIPIGAMGIAFCTMSLGILGWGIDDSSVVSQAAAYTPTAVWLVLLGTISSLFYVPLETYLQHRSPSEIRGTILSATNALTNLFMLLSMGLFFLLRETLQLSPATVFFIAGLIAIPAVISSFSFYASSVGRFLMRVGINTMYAVHLHGFDRIPETGGALLAPNHVSWLDGPLLNGFFPRHPRFMIYTEYTQKWFLRWAASLDKVIPLSPSDGPKAIIKSLKEARATINSGEMVCIFPEGTLSRSGRLNPFSKGVMKIIQGTDAPIYPIYIHGLWGSKLSYRRGLLKSPWKWRRRIDIYVGEPCRDVKDISQLYRKVEELGAKCVQDRLNADEVIPARQFVRQCRSSLFRKKVADSSGAVLTGGKLLAGTLAFQQVLKREVFKDEEQVVGVLLPPAVGGVIANTVLAISGKTSLNLNYTLPDETINYCIKDAGVKRILTSKKFIEKRPVHLDAELIFLEDLKEKITTTDRLWAAMQAFLCPAICTEWKLGLHRLDRHSPLTIIYTSGSTGEPKGVVLTHHNIISNVYGIDYMLSLGKKDTLIGVLPFFHSFGYTVSMWVVLTYPPMGVYHFNPLDARMIGKLIEKYRGTVILATPTFLRNYLKRITPEQFRTIWLIVLGAEKLPQDVAQMSIDKFGVSPVEGYGTTELSPLVSVNLPNVIEDYGEVLYNRRGTVGQCVPGTLAKVVHPETFEELPLDTEGLLLISGPNVMAGYYNQPEKTAQVIKDGWYNTGDFAKLDADGYITITGRQSRFSKIGGEMVPHIRVEEVLATTLDQIDPVPEQDDASPGSDLRLAVTSVPDAKKGERLVVLHRPMNCKPDELLNQLGDCGLPNLWLPSAGSFVEVEEIPLLGTGKFDLKGMKTKALEHFGIE